MMITLQDVCYQLGLSIDGDPVSGCMTGWEIYYGGRSIEVICREFLEVVPGPNDRQGQKWTMNVSWFRDVCGVLEERPIPQHFEQYTRGYIMQLIRGFLFTDQAETHVHMRWARFELHNDSEAMRLRVWRGVLNTIGIHRVDWTPYTDPRIQRIIPRWVRDSQASRSAVCPLLCFPIVEWHQVDRVMRQLGGLQHILVAPLVMDDMHVHDGRYGRGEWYPTYLQGWYQMWNEREGAQVPIHCNDDLRPSRQYLLWYF
ncbi:hypothetical protein PIB30_032546 [Stylosanthes scabra]|uniref:Aminotransferase-like plant mobile domain-containing protein n=1 Tax=Stylosanthes scabra TaxID=79078 RepID=A0ABU6Z909_9FABA|nr:hypothetical protein [Stylosanthes scabra]